MCVSNFLLQSCSDETEVDVLALSAQSDKQLLKSFYYPPFKNNFLLIDWSNPIHKDSFTFYSVINDNGTVFSEEDNFGINTYEIFKKQGEYQLLKTRKVKNQKTGKITIKKNVMVPKGTRLFSELTSKLTVEEIEGIDYYAAPPPPGEDPCFSDVNIPCTGGGGGGGGSYQIVYTYHFTDWYQDYNNNGLPDPDEYKYTDYNGHSSEYVWVPNGGNITIDSHSTYAGGPPPPPTGGGSGYHYGGSGGNAPTNHQAKTACITNPNYSTAYCNCIFDDLCETYYEELVTFDESFTNNERANCIYEQLNAICGPLFQETIGQFQNDPDLHLHWEVGDTGGPRGETSPIDITNNTITITLLDDYVNHINTTDIELAETIIHEAIHANIEAYLDQYHNLANENTQNTLRLAQLYKHYKSLNDPEYTSNWPDHIFMMEYFVEPIANALWELNNYEGSIDNYLYFGWSGLSYWDADEVYISDEELENYRQESININQTLNSCE